MTANPAPPDGGNDLDPRSAASPLHRENDRKIDRKRYRRVRWFFLKVFLSTFWWDVFLNRPLFDWFRTPAIDRWRKTARRFRSLAVEMGGVMIKLGQFLSIRVDILPVEVTRELAGLQDEVPPEPFPDILARIEAEFERPAAEVFRWISPIPMGAASLAQVHRVRLPSGEDAVVKVMRPGIEALVETDLAAVNLAFRWLKLFRRVRERADLDWIFEEFSAVTQGELDFAGEGRNAERMAEDFAEDPRIYIPRVFWDYSGRRVLTLENVGYIKIGDPAAIEAAGISPPMVADRLYNLYMRQVFETHFVHVDPHPGNLFVRPLPSPKEIAEGISGFAPGETPPRQPNRPFQIVFVDFGMTAGIPERLRAALREYAVGLGAQDAHLIVQAFVHAGALLPGADLKRLEEAHEALFRQFWGTRVGDFKGIAMKEARYFLREYRDVIQAAPFQIQADMLFVFRAIGILSGMAAHLDPDFDVWTKTLPFARRYARETMQKDFGDFPRRLWNICRTLFELPENLEGIMTEARRGQISVRAEPPSEYRRILERLVRSADRIAWMALSAGLMVSAAILHGEGPEGLFWKVSAGLSAAVFLRGILKG